MTSGSTRRLRPSTRPPWHGIRPTSPEAAARFEAEFERVMELIVASPETFPMYDEEQRFVMLRWFPYSVVYQVPPGQVDVVAVAHSRRSAGYGSGAPEPATLEQEVSP